MDSALNRKIIANKAKEVSISDIKIGDLVNLCGDCKGNVLIVDTKNNTIKKILSNGEEASSAIFKRGNSFFVVSVEEFLSCFGQVASIEQKSKNSPVILKFKENVQGSKEHTFKPKDKIRRVV